MVMNQKDRCALSEIEAIVTARTEEANGIASFELRALDDAPLPPFDAGAHIDVYLGDTVVRQYSLCNAPSETHRYVIAVLRESAGRGGSARMHELRPGERVRIGVPRNQFALDGGAAPKLLVAGGIGVTPLKAMAHVLAERGIDFELHYFARSTSHAAFRDALQHDSIAENVRFHFDDQGAVLRDMNASLDPARFSEIYLCGPTGFIGAVRTLALERGYAPEQIRVEHFASSAPASGMTFVVEAVRSGVTVTVGEDETIAQALDRVGVQVLTSCEQGLCGACLTPVIEGTPDHRDEYQSDDEKAENAKITICCSRALSRFLRLDI